MRLFLALALVLLAAGPAAHASCLEPVATDTAPSLAAEYLEHYAAYAASEESDEADLARLCAVRTGERLFSLSAGAYREALSGLEAAASRNPAAYFDLAYSLQLAWEQRYLRSYYKHYLDESGRRRGVAAMALGLGGLALLRPGMRGELTGLRTLFTLAGASFAGAGAQYAFDRATAPAIPLPPATVLSIAAPAELERVKEADRSAMTNSLLAGAAGGGASYFVFRAASRGLLRAPNIWAKAGGAALSLAVSWLAYESIEQATRAYLNAGDLRGQETALARTLAELSAEAARSGPDSLATLKLVKATVDQTLLLGALRSGELLQARVARRVAREERVAVAEAPLPFCALLHAPTGGLNEPVPEGVAALYARVADTLEALGGSIPKVFAEQTLRARGARWQLVREECAKEGAPT